jgi:hypothetical protein
LQVSSIEQKTNFLAAYVSAGLSAQLPQLMSQLGIKPRDSFEVGFNRATGLAAVGDMEAAETAVKAAYKQGEPKHMRVWGVRLGRGGCAVMDGRNGGGGDVFSQNLFMLPGCNG